MLKKADPGVILAEIAVKGMQEKKAKKILKIDLRKLGISIADLFVICHGTSDKQVDAIADSVEEEIRKATGEKPFSREGFQTAEWIILDYVNVVVHIFNPEKRQFYSLEDLWSDGEHTEYPDLD
ncbi:MAG: ribosome silencing factor [Flavobacteriales bacterium]|nr:ribosome silencing factor [Flavobacteriales bacterium]